jgi:hypothetical protein
MCSVSSRPRVRVIARAVRPIWNQLRDDHQLSHGSIHLLFSRCSFDDPLPEPPLPGESVPDRIFPTPTDVPVPEPFDVPAPRPVDVPVQTPQDVPAPPSEWPDDPALKKNTRQGLRRFDTPIRRPSRSEQQLTPLSARQSISPPQISARPGPSKPSSDCIELSTI